MLISFCIPTYNRAPILESTMRRFLEAVQFDSDMELVICDNCSTDGTRQTVKRLMEEFPQKNISYFRNEENVRDRNFLIALKHGKGSYRKLLNDYTYITPEGLSEMKRLVLEHLPGKECNLWFVGDLNRRKGVSSYEVHGQDELLGLVYHHLTWISNFGAWDSDLTCLEQFQEKWQEQILQFYWFLHLSGVHDRTFVIDFGDRYGRTQMDNSFRVPYNLFTALVDNYYNVIYKYRDQGLISGQTIRNDKTTALKTFVGWSIRDLLILHEDSNYKTEGAWEICRRHFKGIPYFYYLFVKAGFKKLKKAL